MNVIALVPVRASDVERMGGMPQVGGRPLLAYTIETARKARLVSRLVVTTDSPAVRQLAIELGAEAPFLRPAELAARDTSLDTVLLHAVRWLEEHGDRPDVIVLLEMSHPLRPEGLVDQVVETLLRENLDTVFAASEERATFWEIDDYGELRRVEGKEGETRVTRRPLYKELSGLVSATRVEVVKRSQHVGDRVGLVPIRDLSALVDTQDDLGLSLLDRLLGEAT